MADTPTPRRRRTGRSLNWTEQGIEQAATVGPQDADAAVVSWDKLGNRDARGLLEATEDDDGSG